MNERIGGDNSSMEWSVEGRRLVPIMPRYVPQTMYTVTANQVANMAYAHNATLPDPSKTAKPEGSSKGQVQVKSLFAKTDKSIF